MKNQITQATAALLPRGIKGDAVEQLEKHLNKNSYRPLKLVKTAAGTVAWGYRVQLKASFNRRLRAMEAVTAMVCLAAVPLTPALIALGAVMIAITFRDAYTHNETAPGPFQYWMNTAGDALTATLFLIWSQILTGLISPSISLPGQLMYRSLFVCMPLLATIRMVFRPRPAGEPSFSGKGDWTAEQVYRRIWFLNALWVGMFSGVMALTVTDRPGYVPDFLRGLLPLLSFGVWVCVGRVALRSRVRIETLMTLIRSDEILRKADSLPQEIRPGEPMYRSYLAAQALMFAQMGLTLLGAVEPFLFGRPLVESAFRAFGALLGFVVSAMTWHYVKASNLAAGRALVQIAKHRQWTV